MSHRSSKSFTGSPLKHVFSTNYLFSVTTSFLILLQPTSLLSCLFTLLHEAYAHPTTTASSLFHGFEQRLLGNVLFHSLLPSSGTLFQHLFATSHPPLLSKRPWRPTFSNSIIRSSYFMCFTCSPYRESCHDHPTLPHPPPPPLPP